jgi:N-acetylmuramoyl-L-alanine amidase
MIGYFKQALALGVALVWLAGAALAQQGQLSALARVDGAASRLWVEGEALALDLVLSQPVPWRVRFLAGPPRLVLDFREVDFAGLEPARLIAGARGQVTDLRAGAVRAGWSRLVLALDRPRMLASAELRTEARGGDVALLRLRLRPAEPADFAREVARPDPPGWALPRPAQVAAPRGPRGNGPLVVVLDPGHGGIDPGAERGGHTEAALMLTFAREFKEALLRAGGFQVVMTREADVFVPLETRVALAHAARADVFVSLHADAVAEGLATGATVYTLAAEASDAASEALAERHDRDALMSGVDLTGQDDLIAAVLMDMARTETAPRTDKLAATLVEALRAGKLALHKTPRRGAAFSVLKAPDIPSVLLELGYLSSPADLARLTDAKWRARMVAALVAGLSEWSVRDAAEAALRCPAFTP